MIINIILILLIIYANDDIGAIALLILGIRFLKWLFGPSQDTLDDYYYTRYRNAKYRYERRHK